MNGPDDLRTREDSFARIRRHDTTYSVERKDGRVATYTQIGDVWVIASEADRSGNTITYTYDHDAQSEDHFDWQNGPSTSYIRRYQIAEIDYTSRTARPDVALAHGGVRDLLLRVEATGAKPVAALAPGGQGAAGVSVLAHGGTMPASWGTPEGPSRRCGSPADC